MDVTPPTDSDEVKEWIAAIDWDKVRPALRRAVAFPKLTAPRSLAFLAGARLHAQHRQCRRQPVHC